MNNHVIVCTYAELMFLSQCTNDDQHWRGGRQMGLAFEYRGNQYFTAEPENSWNCRYYIHEGRDIARQP